MPQADGSRPSETDSIVIPPQAIERVLEPREAQPEAPRPTGHPLLDVLTASTDPGDLTRRPLKLTPADG